MTLIWHHERSCKKRISEGSSSPPESSQNKAPVDPPISPSNSHVAKYIEENLQRILRTVLEAQAPPSDRPRKKPLKAKLLDMNCGKFYIECYNFCQQCKDHFATAGAKGPNRIFFAAFFLRDRVNFRWQQYKWKHKAESSVFIIWEEFKTFFCQSLGDFRAFVDSYWAKIKRNSPYQQKDVLDWVTCLEHLQAIFQEFDSVAPPNDNTMIRYFWEGLRPLIRAQLDVWNRDLDFCNEVIDKTVDAEAKTSLQSPSGTRKIDFWYFWGQRPTKKDDKDSRDFKKNNSF